MAEIRYLSKKRSIERETIILGYVHDCLEFESIHGTISEANDLSINGRLIRIKDFKQEKDVEVVADIFNERRELLLSLHSYKEFNFEDNPVESFNCYCADIKRYFDGEISSIEVYTRIKRNVNRIENT